jgi:hypothetical protein
MDVREFINFAKARSSVASVAAKQGHVSILYPNHNSKGTLAGFNFN